MLPSLELESSCAYDSLAVVVISSSMSSIIMVCPSDDAVLGGRAPVFWSLITLLLSLLSPAAHGNCCTFDIGGFRRFPSAINSCFCWAPIISRIIYLPVTRAQQEPNASHTHHYWNGNVLLVGGAENLSQDTRRFERKKIIHTRNSVCDSNQSEECKNKRC